MINLTLKDFDDSICNNLINSLNIVNDNNHYIKKSPLSNLTFYNINNDEFDIQFDVECCHYLCDYKAIIYINGINNINNITNKSNYKLKALRYSGAKCNSISTHSENAKYNYTNCDLSDVKAILYKIMYNAALSIFDKNSFNDHKFIFTNFYITSIDKFAFDLKCNQCNIDAHLIYSAPNDIIENNLIMCESEFILNGKLCIINTINLYYLKRSSCNDFMIENIL